MGTLTLTLMSQTLRPDQSTQLETVSAYVLAG